MLSSGNEEVKSPEVQRILILKWGALGDLVAATPAIKAIRNAFPQAKISIFSNPPYDEIAPAGTLTDEVILFKRHKEFWKILLNVRAQKWDAAFNLSWNSDRSAILCYLSFAPLRIGSGGPGWLGFLYNRRVPPFTKNRHEIDRHLDIVRAAGVTIGKVNPFTFISERALQEAEDNLRNLRFKKQNLLIGMHPGASSLEKSWGEENYGWLGKEIIRRYQADLMVTWGSKEEQMATRVALASGEKAFISPRTIKVENLAALISCCNIYICNCSGPMNVALALDTPIVALLGPTLPEEWGTYGEAHRTLKSPTKQTHDIPRAWVLKVVGELLERQGYKTS